MLRSWPVVLVVIPLVSSSCQRSHAKDPARPLTADPVRPAAVQASLRPLRQLAIGAAADGRIQGMLVDVGMQVERGQALLMLEEPSFDVDLQPAPVSGIVVGRYAGAGTMVRAGMPLLELEEDDVLRVTVPAAEHKAGEPISVWIPAAGESCQARIGRLSLESGTPEAEAQIPNPDFSLKPGMSVEVTFSPYANP